MDDKDRNSEDHTFKSTKKDWTPFFIGIMVLLLGVIIFFYYQNKNLREENRSQSLEFSNTVLKLDSISNELDQKILTIAQLGGEVDTLLRVKEQLENEKRELLTRQDNQRTLLTSLQDKVGGYRELLLAKDDEINELRKLNDELLSENVELKTEKQQLNQSIQEINKAKEELAQKVAFASRLRVEDLKVYAVNQSGREREEPFRNRHIDQLKITFTIGENEVAPIEGKELWIRIVAPDGNVIFDVTRGSGSFMYNGREMFFSAKQEILYDKKSQKVTVFYDKGSDFAEGRHQVEVYTDDYQMGKGAFEVK